MKVIIDPAFWTLFPEGQINLVIAHEIDNTVKPETDAPYRTLLADAKKSGKAYVTEEPFTQNPVIQTWRSAFQTFKTKKGARSSIEALLKRVSQDREFTPINPLVDIYNSISLSFGVPCGGEDLAKIQGDLHLGLAQGGESFRPLGADADAPALPQELIYYDDAGAVCRSLNWREAQRTMLTEQTTDAVLVIESVTAEQHEQANAAAAELKQRLEDYLGVAGQLVTLTKAAPEVEV